MNKGDRYTCECCNAVLVVETPCTCQDQDTAPICTCGEKMKLKK